MAFAIKGKIEGLEGVLKALGGLKESLRNKILRPAMAKAARLLAKEAKSRVPAKRTGQLWRSIGSWVVTTKDGVIGIVGPRKGFETTLDGKPVDPRMYAHFIEGGVRPHALGKGSRLKKQIQAGRMHPGFAARPFLKPAFDALKDQLRELIAKEIGNGIEKQAKKLAAKRAAA